MMSEVLKEKQMAKNLLLKGKKVESGFSQASRLLLVLPCPH